MSCSFLLQHSFHSIIPEDSFQHNSFCLFKSSNRADGNFHKLICFVFVVSMCVDYTITDAWQEQERSYQPGLVFLKKESGALVASAQFLVVRITFSSYVIKVHWVWEMIFVSMWKYIWSPDTHRPLVCNAWWLSAFKFKRSVTSPNPNPTNVYKHLFTTLPTS